MLVAVVAVDKKIFFFKTISGNSNSIKINVENKIQSINFGECFYTKRYYFTADISLILKKKVTLITKEHIRGISFGVLQFCLVLPEGPPWLEQKSKENF